jgi:DNA-binding transcriptional MerR regulator
LEAIPDAPAPLGPQHWSIGQVAKRTGLSDHALRFYERQGLLLHPVQRGPDGRRTYSDSDLDWLDLCIKLRSSGMPLADIRRYTELVRRGPGNEQQRRAAKSTAFMFRVAAVHGWPWLADRRARGSSGVW